MLLPPGKNLLNKEQKKSVEEEGKEFILSQAVIPALGTDTFTVYAHAESTDRGNKLHQFYHWNDSLFISSVLDVSKSEKNKSLVGQFAVEQYKKCSEKMNWKMLNVLSKSE